MEECRHVEPEDCTTQFQTKCHNREELEDSRRRKRSGSASLSIGLSLSGLGLAKLAALKLVVAKVIKAKKQASYSSDVCFEIPRTVCDYRRSSNGFEKSTEDCSTSIQTVCGVEDGIVDHHHHRRRRNVDEEGCVKGPVSQGGTKRKEAETVCETVNREVCTDCKESSVCSPKKVQREVCEE